jgi:hypothetical protein
MKLSARTMLCTLAACLGFLQGSLFAQEVNYGNNLSACKNALASCNPSTLTKADSDEIAASMHQRNLADCRAAVGPCDRSQLTEFETSALDVAVHQRMYPIVWMDSNRATIQNLLLENLVPSRWQNISRIFPDVKMAGNRATDQS